MLLSKGPAAQHAFKPILWHWLLPKQKLYCKVERQGDTRYGSNLFPQSEVPSNLYEFRKEGWYVEMLAGQVSIGGLWNVTIYAKVW